MLRKVFFSFHYEYDLWRVNVARHDTANEGIAAAGFRDDSLWTKAEREGDAAIQRLIDEALRKTSVTVVLIGSRTADNKYVHYAIEKSVERRNGLLGIRIHDIKDNSGLTDVRGLAPGALLTAEAPVYDYEYGKLGDWVETAYKKANPAQR
jgi:hypothetical protein